MIDPEAFEPTEEQFSASIEAPASGLSSAAHRVRPRYSPAAGRVSGSTASTNSAGTAEPSVPAARPLTGIEKAMAERQELETALQHQSEMWREEVADRVERYRNRRSRKRLAGEFSMRLDFEPSRSMSPAAAMLAGATAMAAALAQPEAVPREPEIPAKEEPSSAAAPAVEPATLESALPEGPVAPAWTAPLFRAAPAREVKVIEFPRALVFPQATEPDPNELAEPVLDKPRILDVPESLGAVPPPLVEIAGQSEEEEAPLPEFELPLRVAPLPQRFAAAVIDSLVVMLASGIFAMIVAQSLTDLPHTRPVLALALVIPVFFWFVYQYLFLVHGGSTPGMALSRVRLSAFEGGRVPRMARRWRALALLLSCVSLGFGFLWALFDPDGLCWHDKMTRTYLTLWE